MTKRTKYTCSHTIKHKKHWLFTTASLLFLLTGASTALGADSPATSFLSSSHSKATGPALQLESSGRNPASYLTSPQFADADQVFLVFPSEEHPDVLHRADFYWYTKKENTWELKQKIDASYGRNGSTSEKKEGDGMTPEGTYSFSMAFGIKEDPGSILPYHQVQHGDVWVDDSESVYYNTLINQTQTPDGWNSGEVLENYIPHYHYGLVLNYNSECVPYKGSAIFLHCIDIYDVGSSGCICVPEDIMKDIVKTSSEHTKIMIIK